MSAAWKDRGAPRTAFVQRHGLAGAGHGRVWWLSALEACIEAGELVAEGGELSQDEAFAIAGVAARAGEVPFPLPYASASAAAAGLHQLVRGFSKAAPGDLRQALAVAMVAAARCCRRIIELDVEQRAAAMRKQLGEDD